MPHPMSAVKTARDMLMAINLKQSKHGCCLDLNVPQVREGDFYPSCLEKGIRSERALRISLAEMYVQGVSTRKVSAIIEEMCGFTVTSSQVSRAATDLDKEFEVWRNRRLGKYL